MCLHKLFSSWIWMRLPNINKWRNSISTKRLFMIFNMWRLEQDGHFETTCFGDKKYYCILIKISSFLPGIGIWPHFVMTLFNKVALMHPISNAFSWMKIYKFTSSLKFVPKGSIDNIPALVQIEAWHRPGNKPLHEPMMVRLLAHISVTWPQWVKHCGS